MTKVHRRVSARILVLTVITASYMVVEFVVGYLVGSLALISDSFHMLSDVLALLVALWARRYSKKDSTETMTYGWRRAEVVGALMNAVFLLALCVNIVIEAVERFFHVEEVRQPQLLLIVGGAGLAVNVLGLFLFAHGHSHGHSHGHDHGHKKRGSHEPIQKEEVSAEGMEIAQDPVSAMRKAPNMNVRGIFLHVLGDALGSIAVIVSSLIIWLTDFKLRFYIDPIMSLLITAILLKSTIPLLRRAAKILLQAVPDDLDVKEIQDSLSKVEDVLDIHEIHIWQLSNDLLVASLHITCYQSCNFMKLAISLKSILHSYGIHATTIQPEFVDDSFRKDSDCLLRCETQCQEVSCCTKRKSTVVDVITPDFAPK